MRSRPNLPSEISTNCQELDLVWRIHAVKVVDRPGILIPDTDDDLTWHAFLGHSIDMQGFRAAEFAGVDSLTRPAPKFISLRERGIGVSELAALWDISAIQQHLRTGIKGVPLQATLDVLRSAGGPVGESLADAFEWFPWRRGHWSVRSLLQNSSVLKNSDCSFRAWLQHECAQVGVIEFPPPDFQKIVVLSGASMTLERALRIRSRGPFTWSAQL